MNQPDETALFRMLEARTNAAPDDDAIVGEDVLQTFGELFERVDRTMGLLVAEGWTPDAVIGISVQDVRLHLAAGLALYCLGGRSVCLPGYEVAESNRAVAKIVGVAFVLRDGAHGWLDGIRAVDLSDDAIMRAPRGFHHARVPPAGADAIFVKTSGSTGVPKVVGVKFDRIAEAVKRCAADEKERRVMRTSPIEFDSSRMYRLLALLAGNATILYPRNMTRLGEVCSNLDVSQVHIGTYNLSSLVRSRGEIARMPAGCSILTGGSRVSGAIRAMTGERLTDQIWVSYATSEFGRISTATPEENVDYPEGIGLPLPIMEVEIVDAEGRPVARGDVGEIRVRCKSAPSAYLGGGSTQFRDGWFHPNDLVSWPEGGPLVYHGRTDDVMLLNGIKVSGGAIEDALVAQPGVAEAVAFPMRSRVHGEIPAAAVVLAPEVEQRDPAALLKRCRELLGARAPRRIVVLDAIPRTLTGKPLKTALAEL